MKKKKIAIVAGGDSSEFEVSLRSAQGILDQIDQSRYDAEIVPLRSHDLQTLNHIAEFDYVYITIHGTPGENGRLQGFLDMMGVPYNCCGVLAAAITFNKYACNHYLSSFGIRIADSLLLRQGDKYVDSQIVGRLGLPCFIKSNVGGSSFGCTKVHSVEEVTPAIEKAFEEGDEVICEAFMPGIEVTSGAYSINGEVVALPLTEIVTSREFFDYVAKYNGEVQEITPARIPDVIRDEVQTLTRKIYSILGCKGIIRIDYIISEDWKIQLLEINTTPGMTATSLIPQQIRAARLNITEILTAIIENNGR